MIVKADHQQYLEYLKNRSKLGLFYRRFYLYPLLCLFAKGKTLDVGCGIGDFLRFKKNSVGVDINPEIIKHLKCEGLDVNLFSNELPFQDNKFDSVVFDNVIEHINDPYNLLTEIHRVLKSGSNLIVGIPGIRGFKADSDHKVFYTKKSLAYYLESNFNFKRSKFLSMPVPLPFGSKLLKQYCYYGIFKKV